MYKVRSGKEIAGSWKQDVGVDINIIKGQGFRRSSKSVVQNDFLLKNDY